MKRQLSILTLALALLPVVCSAQSPPDATQVFGDTAQSPGLEGKLNYYLTETYLNPSTFTAPAFRAGIRMASPPGNGSTEYPQEWRHGVDAFRRNYGDAFAQHFRRHALRREW